MGATGVSDWPMDLTAARLSNRRAEDNIFPRTILLQFIIYVMGAKSCMSEAVVSDEVASLPRVLDHNPLEVIETSHTPPSSDRLRSSLLFEYNDGVA